MTWRSADRLRLQVSDVDIAIARDDDIEGIIGVRLSVCPR